MHQHTRRKKKRINYGVRTVELVRGAKGYGFTISGQQPCILSCIVPGSPAELAGLRSGDYLIAVNSHGVGKVPHDDVVGLIARSTGALRLQIAKNYYSDSSDEGSSSSAVRTKPKHRPKANASSGNDAVVEAAGTSHPQCRVAKVVRDLQSGAMFDTSARFGLSPYRWNMSNPPPPPSFRKSDSEKVVHRTIVGYMGTIDIPKKLYPTSMTSILRKCIKKLKVERRTPTTVVLTIHVTNIKLTNSEGAVVAEYPSQRIVFCSSFTDEEEQYFGILTKAAKNNEDEEVPDSCHVFVIYSKMTDHQVHSNTCNTFGFTCTRTSELDSCQEFPHSCDSLIGAIQTLYITDLVEGDGNLFDSRRQRDATSPQPSNVSSSTAHSSNSDSGIGFKDDYRSHSDRHYNVEFPPSPQELNVAVPSFGINVIDPIGSRLAVRAKSDSRWSDFSGCRSRASNFGEHTSSFEDNDRSELKAAECQTDRLLLDVPNGISGSTGAHGSTLINRSANGSSCPSTLSGQCTVRPSPANSNCSGEAVGATSKFQGVAAYSSTMTADKIDKLSPKVYTGKLRPQVHSMENLKSSSRPDDYAGSMIDLLSHRDGETAKDKSFRGWGSLQEIRKDKESSCNVESCNKNSGYGVHTWAASFEKLLEDPKGLQTFAEFLKKEFSHENIYFWAACERYADTDDVSARQQLAQQIYIRYLSCDAAEPVNVDSHAAGQITQERLYAASGDLFLQTQKQVFNLMKFDSYPRFLRSDLYQRCLETGSGVVSSGNEELHLTSSPNIKLKKSLSDAEDRCRKSILPWYRKNRSKSKDRGETEYNKVPVRGETIYKSFTMVKRDTSEKDDEDSTSISSSRSSLASWDIALRQSFTKHSTSSCEGRSNENREVQVAKCCTGLCRVILPDGSTTVVPTSQLESVRDVITRLLEKRALRYLTYDVVVLATDEIVGLKCPSSILASQEVEVVPTKTLKVDLPSRRVITVVAHRGSTLKEVLKPLLNKYGVKLEFVTVWAGGHPVSIDTLAFNAPSRLTLTTNDEDIFVRPPSRASSADVPKGQPTLDEITNKVFEELLVGKSSGKHGFGDYSSKSDDQRSDCSSSNSSKFFSRDSTLNIRKKAKSKSIRELGSHSDGSKDESSHSQPPLIAKWRNGVKLQLPSRCDELYEGLKRAQRSRLEDQRGTEINFELPDFLKGNNVVDGKKLRKQRAASANCESSKFYDSAEDKMSSDRGSDSSENLDRTVVDKDKTLVENDFCHDQSKGKPSNPTPTKLATPPPLPPKPKSLSNTLKNNVLLTRPFQRVVHCDKKSI